MQELIFFIFLSFLAGTIVKTVDHIEDEEKKKHIIRFPLAIIYGILIGYLISQSPFSMIFLAAVFTQIIMKKVDNISHKLGYFAMILSLIYFGFPEFVLFPFMVFLIFSSLDELDKIIFWNKPKWIQDFRPFLELSAIPFLLMGQWQYLTGILSFDLGYISSNFACRCKKTKKYK
ncbi:MAG: hypothetical protein PHU63_03700 [Candidatus ainarchaeum sp.]|nr:hypothetical protein [Candidatus ainarchaeum sp.]